MQVSHAQEDIVRVLAEICKGGPQITSPKDMFGPTACCNIVIQGVIMWGDAPRGKKLTELLAYGVSHFLDCRAAPVEVYLPVNHPNLHYHHLDVGANVSTGSSNVVAKDIKALLAQVISERGLLYVHCKDGHTVSGIVICAYLSFIYGLTMLKAASICAQLHACRGTTDNIDQLFNTSHKVFLRDLCENDSPVALLTPPSSHGMPHMNPDLLARSLGGSSHNEMHGVGTKGSRFEHSQGGGGGKTTLNLFDNSPSHSDEVTPTRRGRAAVAVMSSSNNSHNNNYASEAPSMQQQQQQHESMPKVPSLNGVDWRPVSDGDQHQQQHYQQQQQRSQSGQTLSDGNPPMRSVSSDGTTTSVLLMVRTTPSHSWGLMVSGAGYQFGPVVRRVLPHSPAEAAGFAPGMTVCMVDSFVYNASDDFDWITQGKTSITVVVVVNSVDGGNSLQQSSRSVSDHGGNQHQQQQQQYEHFSHPRQTATPQSGSTSPHNAPPSSNPSPVASGSVPMFDLKRDRSIIGGPTSTTNWVVPGRLLCGPVPEPRQRTKFDLLVKERFDVIVSLLESEDAPQAYLNLYEQATQKSVRIVTLPMEDGNPIPQAMAARVLETAKLVSAEVLQGKKVYVHCKGGHGRTGLLITCILADLYKMSGMKAVNMCEALHSCRADPEDSASPATQEQRISVISLLTNGVILHS